MRKIIHKIALGLMTLGITLGTVAVAPVAFATPAQAVNSWEVQKTYCDWVYVYRHWDFDWWEETFQGKRDYDQYIYSYYRYNPTCHNTYPY
jgi:hypothetical protein